MGIGPVTTTLLILALVAALAVGIQAARRPILFRMAARNAGRRPRQTATVIAGLLVGTAIMSAAIVAGDSAGSAIRGSVYQALGHVDQTITAGTFQFYPEEVFLRLEDDPQVAGAFDGIAPNVIWEAAADNPRTDLFEPRTALVGFDPARDVPFGDFELVGGGSWDAADIGQGEAIATKRLADELDLELGDTVHLAYTDPIDPLLPDVFPLNGTLAASIDTGLLPDAAAALLGTLPIVDRHPVEVEEDATQILVVLGWQPGLLPPPAPATTQLQITVVSPSGDRTSADVPAPPEVTMPLWLNVTAAVGQTLEVGTWQVEVSAGRVAAAQVPYQGAAVVLYPVFDLQALAERAGELEEEFAGFGPDGFDPDSFLDDQRPPKEANVTVVAITDGGRGDQFDFRRALFLPKDDLQTMIDREGEINVLKFSNPGGIAEGGRGTEAAVALLEAAIIDLDGELSGPAIAYLEVNDRKREFLQIADDAGATMTSLLLFAGSLSIASGLLLIVNIFTMLAEERRSELGMARAVGLSRRDLVRLFLFEGSLYAVIAAAIGALLGLGLAAALVAGLNILVSNFSGPDGAFPAIPYQPSWNAYLAAFAGGALLTFVTIFFASRRLGRLNIVRAIRQIEEPEGSAPTWVVLAGIPLAAIGLFLTAAGWLLESLSLQVFGPLALVVGLGMALQRTLPRRRLNPWLAGLLAGYYALTYFVITEYQNIEEANIVGPIRGIIMTLAIVVLVVHFERGTRIIGGLLLRMRRFAAVAIPAMSYPLHRRFRTGMTLAIFAIVILAIGFFTIFGGLFETDPEDQTGGFHIEATTTLDVDGLAAFDRGLIEEGVLETQVDLVVYDTFEPDFITVSGERTGQFGPPEHNVYGVEEAFVEEQEFRLLWRLPEYADDAAAYQALLERDDAVIVAYQYSTNEQGQDLSHEVGEPLQINLGEQVQEYTIIGIQEQFHFPGVFLPQDEVESLFPRTNDLYLFKVEPGQDAREVAKLLERNYRDVGMDAVSSVDEVQEEQEAFRQILGAMKLFLGLGLIVGILSLGIVTSRSVLERRQEIGMLRAIGYTGNQIRTLFLLEVTGTILVGALVGFACSVLVTYGLWFALIKDLNYPYTIPWVEVAIILGVAYVTALAATLAPIRRSARVAPAEALRYVE
ncbi:MAG: FtsX-like permease family protein [Thermoplasmatota archaeon]